MKRIVLFGVSIFHDKFDRIFSCFINSLKNISERKLNDFLFLQLFYIIETFRNFIVFGNFKKYLSVKNSPIDFMINFIEKILSKNLNKDW